MGKNALESYDLPAFDEAFCVGEGEFGDISKDVAKDANKKVRRAGDNEFIYLGQELGSSPAKDTRYRNSAKQGFVTAYIRSREFISEHETATKITLASVAIGSVIAGVAAMHHKRKS
jgi:hypothetical protein